MTENAGRTHHDHFLRPSRSRPARHDPLLQGLAAGSRAAHAHEQPRSGRRRRPGPPDRLRRDRPGRPQLGVLRRHRRARCKDLGNDETLLVQSGKPVGVFRTHPGAPRVLIANALLVPAWATFENFRDLEDRGLTMYGQMTAGSWIYIGIAGHPAGHLRDAGVCGPAPLRRTRWRGACSCRPASAAWAGPSRWPRR